jgi:hypothetical protein
MPAVATLMTMTSSARARQFPLREPAHPTIAFALNLLKDGEGGVVPDAYGADIRHGFNYAVFKGWAAQTATGRLEITEAGRKELTSTLNARRD